MRNFTDSETYLAYAQLDLDSEGISAEIINKDLILLKNVNNGKIVPITRQKIENYPSKTSNKEIITVYDLCKHIFEIIDKYEAYYNA
ncbi:MAG: hypothetical protein QXN00_02195, partial [Candidatus Aenigmatarchaeota archaeon]